jgi:hypothetical protein
MPPCPPPNPPPLVALCQGRPGQGPICESLDALRSRGREVQNNYKNSWLLPAAGQANAAMAMVAKAAAALLASKLANHVWGSFAFCHPLFASSHWQLPHRLFYEGFGETSSSEWLTCTGSWMDALSLSLDSLMGMCTNLPFWNLSAFISLNCVSGLVLLIQIHLLANT